MGRRLYNCIVIVGIDRAVLRNFRQQTGLGAGN